MPDHWSFNFASLKYRIKPEPTREEITAKWVKDNDVKVGDRVKLLQDGSIGEVTVIGSTILTIHFGGLTTSVFNVEELKKVTTKIVPFTFEDREEFRGKWVRYKGGDSEFSIRTIYKDKIFLSDGAYFTYEIALEDLEFIDGKPFGKEIWE